MTHNGSSESSGEPFRARESHESYQEERNVFHGLHILGFFRDKRQVDSGENRPILPIITNDSYQTTTRSGERPPAPKRRPSELWGFLKIEVEKETFHIQDLRSKSERLQSKEVRNLLEIHVPYEFSLLECFLGLMAYLSISIVAYSYLFENWSPIESMYFATVTFTTIGYGDFAPNTKGGRIFCCFFALIGICVLGIALGVVGSKMIERRFEALERAEEKIVKDVLKLVSTRKSSGSMSRTGSFESVSTVGTISSNQTSQELLKEEKCIQTTTRCASLLVYVPSLIPLLLGACLIARNEGWTWDETVYYMVTTCTTIGYGDVFPHSNSMKLFAIFYIPLAVGAMGHCLGSIANYIIESRRKVFDEKFYHHEMTLEDLMSMDEDHDGIVTEAEFLAFMLVAMKKVDRELIDHIRQRFHELDLTRSGTLGRADLEAMARKNLRSARTKLRLREYKKRLAEESHHSVV